MPAQRFGDVGMQLREALDVQLVDERLVPRRAQRSIVAPRERRVDDGGERRVCGAVALVERRVVRAGSEAEQRFVPLERPADDLGVRIDDDLVRIEAMARDWARTGRGRGSRRAGRAARPAGSRARPCRSARSAEWSAIRCRPRASRTGTARRASRVRRRSRSSRRRRPTWRRADTEFLARRALNDWARRVGTTQSAASAIPSHRHYKQGSHRHHRQSSHRRHRQHRESPGPRPSVFGPRGSNYNPRQCKPTRCGGWRPCSTVRSAFPGRGCGSGSIRSLVSSPGSATWRRRCWRCCCSGRRRVSGCPSRCSRGWSSTRSSTPASAPFPSSATLFDFVWKANDWNLALLERHAEPGSRATAGDWLFLSLCGLVLFGLALLPVLILLWIGRRLI